MADIYAFWAKSQADKKIAELPNGFTNKGEVNTYFDLPLTDNKVGDLYTVQHPSGEHIAGRYAWGVSAGELKWYHTDGDNDFVSQGELESILNLRCPSVNPLTGEGLTNPIFVPTSDFTSNEGDVGEKDKYGNPITPIAVQKTKRTAFQHPNIGYEDLGRLAKVFGFCQNLGRERVPQTGGSYIPTKLYIDTSYTPKKSELSKLDYTNVGIEGLDMSRLVYFYYYNSTSEEFVEQVFIGVAREIYTYQEKPTLQDAISDLCFYFNGGTITPITDSMTQEEYTQIETVYTYAFAIVVFPNCDSDITNMTVIYCTNPFIFGEITTPLGWQQFQSPFTLTATGVPTDKLYLFTDSEDGNGEWYYFADPKSHITYKIGTVDISAGSYLETGTLYFYIQNSVITKIYFGVNNVAMAVNLG